MWAKVSFIIDMNVSFPFLLQKEGQTSHFKRGTDFTF